MPCANSVCECGDDCKCSPGNPGCDACAASMKQKARGGAASVFNLLVTATFTDEASETEFKNTFLPYAKWIHENEPNTVMYQLMKSDKTPLFYNIIERYADKERDYLGTHRNTPQFQEFRATLKEMQEEGKVILSGESYIDLS